jgi:hypothetical protein
VVAVVVAVVVELLDDQSPDRELFKGLSRGRVLRR